MWMGEGDLCKRVLEGDGLRVIDSSMTTAKGTERGREERGTYDKEADLDMNEIWLI